MSIAISRASRRINHGRIDVPIRPAMESLEDRNAPGKAVELLDLYWFMPQLLSLHQPTTNLSIVLRPQSSNDKSTSSYSEAIKSRPFLLLNPVEMRKVQPWQSFSSGVNRARENLISNSATTTDVDVLGRGLSAFPENQPSAPPEKPSATNETYLPPLGTSAAPSIGSDAPLHLMQPFILADTRDSARDLESFLNSTSNADNQRSSAQTSASPGALQKTPTPGSPASSQRAPSNGTPAGSGPNQPGISYGSGGQPAPNDIIICADELTPTAFETGGTTTGKGHAEQTSDGLLLIEGDSFDTWLQHTYIVPSAPRDLIFRYSDLTFDTLNPSAIKDAFEVALLDSQGRTQVLPFRDHRDSYYNIAENQPAAYRMDEVTTETSSGVTTVSLDISKLIPGQEVTFVFRLINNDQTPAFLDPGSNGTFERHDTNTKVKLLGCNKPPEATIALVNDTAPTGPGSAPYQTDKLTNDPRVQGTATDDHGVVKLEVRVDGSAWQDITGNLQNGHWQIDPGSLVPGGHQIDIRATDAQDASTTASLVFQVNHPPIPDSGGDRSSTEGTSLHFDGSASTDAEGIFAYRWLFPDGSVVNGTSADYFFADDGVYQVVLEVTDTAGSIRTSNAVVTIANVPPTLTINGLSGVDEGATYVLSLQSSDPGTDTITNWLVHWGDGQTTAVNGNPSSTTHVYADGPNHYTITAEATDDDGTWSSNSQSISVANVAPTLTISGPSSINEGSIYTLSLSSMDPGQDNLSSWTIHWGDGDSSTVNGNPSNVTHVFPPGSHVYTVTANATDEDGTWSSNSQSVTVNNIAPTLTISGSSTSLEGSIYNLGLMASDPGGITISSWTINWGDGHSTTLPGNPSVASHLYADGDNNYTISAVATDADGTWSSNSLSLAVKNVAPVLTIGGAAFSNEGSLYTLTLASQDPGDDTISQWVIHWGDGVTSTVSGNPGSTTHVYADNGTYLISATATDEDGTYAANNRTISISNVAPTVTPANTQNTTVNTPITLQVASFTDPGFSLPPTSFETFTATINWGDVTGDQPATPTVIPGSAGILTTGIVNGSHIYATAGSFIVTVTVWDDDGGIGTGTFTIIVAPSQTYAKFYVVNHGDGNGNGPGKQVFKYDPSFGYLGQWQLGQTNTSPRGITTNAGGTRYWVVDSDRRVGVYDIQGNQLGVWRAQEANAPQDITTDGTDIWVVSSSKNRIYRYAGGAGFLTGNQEPTSSFELDCHNNSPTGLVIKGNTIWVTDDSCDGRVFVYSRSGNSLGSWKLDSANDDPTGITLDPNGGTDLWVVDIKDDTVYKYANSQSRLSGSATASSTYMLNGANRHPEGIADPPPAPGSVVAPVPPSSAITATLAQQPLAFEANQGQTDPQVRFLSRGSGYAMFLTPTEAVMSLQPTGTSSAEASPISTVRMQFIGANPDPRIDGINQQVGVSNYLIGSDPSQWQTDVSNYGGVHYHDLYEGVDLVFYGNQRQLEYDFVVAPQADPRSIKLQFAGTDNLSIDTQGNLVLHTAGGDLVQHAPILYQETNGVRQSVAGHYVLLGEGEVGFSVEAYNHSQQLTIDPILSYSTYLGGSSGDDTHTIAVDSAGNVYVTGATLSSNFPTQNPLQPTFHGDQDVFVSKLSPQGSALVYSTYIGGGDLDYGSGITVDDAGNAYVAGLTRSTDFPTTPGAFQRIYGGANGGFLNNGDGIIFKLNASGTAFDYSTYLGGSGKDAAQSIAIDASGNAYVTGAAYDGMPTTPGAFQPNFAGGGDDIYVAKLNPSGTALGYLTYLGGSGMEEIPVYNGIAVDVLGNAYIAGSTDSTNFPTTSGTVQPNFGGGGPRYGDGVVIKLNPSGSALVYSTYLGGSSSEWAGGIAIDSFGNAYVAGSTQSANFPVINAFQLIKAGGDDAYVTKLNPTGSAFIYSTYLGGSGTDRIDGIDIDDFGNAYVIGTTNSLNFPTAHAIQPTWGGGSGDDAFVTKLSSSGSSLIYSSYLGGAREDFGHDIAVDRFGNAYVTGYTESTNFPITHAFQPTFGGTYDAFIAKVSLAPPTLEVRSPDNASAFPTGTTILITGFASAPVLIDGKPVDVLDPSGNFFTRAVVSPGQNVFHFTAIDSLGQATTASLTINGVQNPPGQIDFSLLSEVSASFGPIYQRTSFSEQSKVIYTDVAIQNKGQYLANTPLLVGITHISDPSVRVSDPDGVTPDGIPYYDFSHLVANGALQPGELSGSLSLAFYNPEKLPFTYDLVYLGQLNRAPYVTSVPDVEALSGRTYLYQTAATDPDGDPVSFTLVTAPPGMTVNGATGLITWLPTTADVGTHAVALSVADGRGGRTEQQYVMTVLAPPPNRPPVFTSVPVVNAQVITPYQYQALASDPDGDALVYAVSSGPSGLSINASTGLVTWTPTATQLGDYQVTLRVADQFGGSAQQTYVIRVSAVLGNHSPVIITDPVTSAVQGHTYQYDVNAIDPDQDPLTYSLPSAPLGMTIDPGTGLISWPVSSNNSSVGFAARMGSTGRDWGYSITTDALGNVYTTGQFAGTVDFDPGPGVFNLSSVGTTDAFVSKTDRNGNFLWARSVGGTGNNVGEDITVDAAGNVYVSGEFSGTADFDPGSGTLNLTSAGNQDIFIWKLTTTGDLGWARRAGASGIDYGADIAVDNSGNVYSTGYFSGTVDFDPGSGTYNLTSNTAHNPFVWKLNPQGDFIWAQSFAGVSDNDFGSSIVTDNAGMVYMTGRIGSKADVWKITGNGQVVWQREVAGTGSIEGIAVLTDAAGSVYVGGQFSGTSNFDPGGTSFTLSSAGARDAFLWKLNSLGQFQWARRWGGSQDQDVISGLALDQTGNIYAIGAFQGTADFGPGGSIPSVTSMGREDVLIAQLSPSGQFLKRYQYGGAGSDVGFGVAIDGAGNVFSTGFFSGTSDFDPSSGTLNLVSAGQEDIFVTGFVPLDGSTRPITVRVDDGRGGFDTQSYALHVINSTSAEIQGTAYNDLNHNGIQDPLEPGLSNWVLYLDQNHNGQRDAGEQFTTTDANGNYNFSNLVTANYRVTLEPQSHWSITNPAIGYYDVPLSNGQIASGKDFGTYLDTSLNLPPSITSSAPSQADIGQLYRYNATAFDPDFDPLTFDLVVKPVGMTIQPTSGTIVWIPTADQFGLQDVTLRVQDGRGGVALQSFQVTVNRPNTAPVITSVPHGPAIVNVNYTYQVLAQDADGDPITYRLDANPTGMSINPITGLVTWTPTASQIGTQHVAVTARDGRGAETTQSFDLPVVATAPNQPPTISSTPRGVIRIGATYLYQVLASDPNGDPLTYSLPIAPAGMTIEAAGLVTWVPTAAQFGPNAVQVRVEDGRGGFVTQSYSISVVTQDSNQPPSIVSTPSGLATVGHNYAYDLHGTDPDGDPLVWQLDLAPVGMSIDPSQGTLRWVPTTDQLGIQNVVVRVLDNRGGYATQSYQINVRAINIPPNITSTPPTTATSNVAYVYAVLAIDPDNDPLSFSLTANPAGMIIDATTGLIQWTPTSSQLGNQSVSVRVDDGQGGFATQNYTIVVSATANQPPTITSTPVFVATVSTPYQYAVTATDPNNDSFLFTLLNAPAGMTINPTSGLIQWTPNANQMGNQNVIVAAIDSHGAGGSQSFVITVLNTNNPPTITSSPLQVITAGLAYGYDLRASDPDGDPLTYSLNGPAGMTIDALGRVTWAPAIPDVGTHRVDITVADNRGGSITQSYDLVVQPDLQTPRINLFVSSNPINVGSPVTFVVTATDNVGVVSRALTINGSHVNLDASGRVTLIADPAGQYAIVATASDAAGNTGQATTTLFVIDNSDQNPPDVAITSPTDDAVINAPINVLGTAFDANLVNYTLSVAPLGSDTFTEIFRGTSSVTNGVLGRFDPTGLENDTYVLRLTATDAGGNISSIDTTVNVTGNLKVGNFTLSFTDLSIPVGGIPITVARTYDTLTAGNSGVFGYGWRLEFRDVDLRTSVRSTGEEEYGVYNPFQEGSRVYLTMPGGKREGFTFHPQQISGIGGIALFRPKFVPDRGVTSQLAVPDNVTLLRVGNGYHAFFNGGELPFNPSDSLNYAGRYTLTTKEGIAYNIDAVSGDLLSVFDNVGNTLSYSDTEIRSSTGQVVTFDHDPQGRITAVTDPLGQKIHYQYANGDLTQVTDRQGNTTQFVYQGPRPHFLTKVIDPLGRNGVRTEYDAQGRLIQLIDAANNSVQLSHDPDHSLETVTDALGHPTVYEYDAYGNVVREVNALGGTTLRTYDDADRLLSETNPLGQRHDFTYDGDGNVLTERDPLGNINRSTYTSIIPGFFAQLAGARPMSLLATSTDPLGNTVSNSYNGAGNLIATTDAAGHVNRFAYDGAGNQISITDALNHATLFAYDGLNRLTKQTDGTGHETRFTYDANGNQLTQTTTLTGPGGLQTVTTTTTYDQNSRPIAVRDAEGNTTHTEYDANGHQVATIDARGNRTQFQYDDRGQLVNTLFADNTSTQTTFDAAGHRIATTDRAGHVTRFEYDALGRLTVTIYPDNTPNDPNDNPRTQTQYDAAGQVIAQIDELGHRTEFGYDLAGRQTSVTNALNQTSTSTFDAAGRLVTTTDALGHATQFLYDNLGRRTTTLFANNTQTRSAYDALGRSIAETDQSGRVTRYEYDTLGRLTAVVDALNQRTQYGYDEAGDLITQTDANLHTTHYEYDRLSRRVATILPLGQRSTTTYDPNSNVSSTTDFNGATTSFDYDVNNRLLAKHFPDTSSVSFTYTTSGQRATYTDSRGVTNYVYDERDRLLSRTDPDGQQISYTYDAAGNRTSLMTAAGTVQYGFDQLNRTASVTDPNGGVTGYSYDAAGRLVRTDLPNNTFETRSYDAVNHLLFLENRGPSGVISSYRYTLDPNGNRIRVVEDTGRQVDYQYDPLYRLTQEKITDSVLGNRTIDYVLDPVGNRLSRNDSAEGITAYTYDNNDRLLTETLASAVAQYSYDNNGNTLSRVKNATDQAFYHWDTENRMVGAEVTDTNGTKHLNYQYDAEGIRVSSTVDGQVTRYLIDNVQPYAQVLLEYQPSGIMLVSYVYGNDLISQNRGGAKSFYHVDGLGSTRALSNAAGVVTDRYVYEAFGRMISQTGSTGNEYLFAGEQRDGNVELNYQRARYLSVGTGRFIGQDPFAGEILSPITMHRFLYANANPIGNVDPTGKWASVPGFPIHQDAIDTVLSSVLDNNERLALKYAQEDIDRYYQAPTDQYIHALRGSRLESVVDAKMRANQWVRGEIERARDAEANGNHFVALRHLGYAMHTLQDATSPAHIGFQVFDVSDPKGVAAHLILDISTIPSYRSQLLAATKTAYLYFTGAIALPLDFFPNVPDTPPEVGLLHDLREIIVRELRVFPIL